MTKQGKELTKTIQDLKMETETLKPHFLCLCRHAVQPEVLQPKGLAGWAE